MLRVHDALGFIDLEQFNLPSCGNHTTNIETRLTLEVIARPGSLFDLRCRCGYKIFKLKAPTSRLIFEGIISILWLIFVIFGIWVFKKWLSRSRSNLMVYIYIKGGTTWHFFDKNVQILSVISFYNKLKTKVKQKLKLFLTVKFIPRITLKKKY